MRILLLHNYYQQSGGEDSVVQQEKSLLQDRGHEVDLLAADNGSITGVKAKLATAAGTIYSRRSYKRVEQQLATFKPELVHVHNFFPQLSPSVYYACSRAGIPVVQTLHNFRLVCPNALLFREGKPCEACIGKFVAWPGIANACYRKSRVGSSVLAGMITMHRIMGTWETRVDAYISLSGFARSRLVAGGMPSRRLFVKPNFVAPDPGPRQQSADFALFVGRLSPEKGVNTLLSAWSRLPTRKLKIAGDGPLRNSERESDLNVEFLGQKSVEQILTLIGDAKFLILPSECYENFPRVIVEAFAKGVAVLASRIGSPAEIIADGKTGLLFRAGDPEDLADKAEWLFAHPHDLQRMGDGARNEFVTKYTADENYQQLMTIYDSAFENARVRYS